VINLACDRLSDKLSHTRCNHNDDCGEKSREASSKTSGSEVTFVHNCIGSSSGKKASPSPQTLSERRGGLIGDFQLISRRISDSCGVVGKNK